MLVGSVEQQRIDKALLIALAGYADDKLECFPSITTLSEDIGRVRGVVIAAARRLEQRGLISRHERARDGKRGSNSKLYRLHPENSPPPEADDHGPAMDHDHGPPMDHDRRRSRSMESPITVHQQGDHSPSSGPEPYEAIEGAADDAPPGCGGGGRDDEGCRDISTDAARDELRATPDGAPLAAPDKGGEDPGHEGGQDPEIEAAFEAAVVAALAKAEADGTDPEHELLNSVAYWRAVFAEHGMTEAAIEHLVAAAMPVVEWRRRCYPTLRSALPATMTWIIERVIDDGASPAYVVHELGEIARWFASGCPTAGGDVADGTADAHEARQDDDDEASPTMEVPMADLLATLPRPVVAKALRDLKAAGAEDADQDIAEIAAVVALMMKLHPARSPEYLFALAVSGRCENLRRDPDCRDAFRFLEMLYPGINEVPTGLPPLPQ